MRLHLYLSPHIDDVVLSCGGLIHRQVQRGERVMVLTIMAGDPPPDPHSTFATELSRLWSADEPPMAVRRGEDEAALTRLGAAWQHWDYPDCIYRHDPRSGQPLYPTRDAIFGEVHPQERAVLVPELRHRLQTLCDEHRPAVVYALMTAGHHVDHQIVQWAAQQLVTRGWSLRYYEDYPYVEDPANLDRALQEAGGHWQGEIEPLSEADLLAKTDAIACYRSQLGILFGGEEAMRRRVRAYACSLSADSPAERYWRPVREVTA